MEAHGVCVWGGGGRGVGIYLRSHSKVGQSWKVTEPGPLDTPEMGRGQGQAGLQEYPSTFGFRKLVHPLTMPTHLS